MSASVAKGPQPQTHQRTMGMFPFTQTKEEDDLVMRLVLEHGAKNWSFIAKSLPGRIGKQCR